VSCIVDEDADALVTVTALMDPEGDGVVGVVVGDVALLPPQAASVASVRLAIADRHTRFIHASPCVHRHARRG
jgi:hypothetical protein